MASPEASSETRPRRLGCFVSGLLGCSGFTFGALAAAAVFAPRLLGETAAGLLESRLGQGLEGRLNIGSVDLAWTRAVQVRDVTLMEPSGKEVLTASWVLPSLLDYLLADSTDDLRCEVEIRQADFEQSADGSWNWQRVLFGSGEKDWGQLWNSEIAPFGQDRGWNIEFRTKGELRIASEEQELLGAHLQGELWMRPHSLGGDLELTGPGDLDDTELTLEWRASRKAGQPLSDVDFECLAQNWSGAWVPGWLPADLARTDWFGDVDELRLRGQSDRGESLLLEGALRGEHGQLDLVGHWAEGQLLLDRPEALRYRGRPQHSEGRWSLLGDGAPELRLFHRSGESLVWSCSKGRIGGWEGGLPRNYDAGLRVAGVGLEGRGGRILLEPGSWNVEVSAGGDPGTVLILDRQEEQPQRFFVQLRGGGMMDWSEWLLRSQSISVGVLESFTVDDWPKRWIGERIDLDVTSRRLEERVAVDLRAQGDLGSLLARGSLSDEMFSAGDEGRIELKGQPQRLRYAALGLLPVYKALMPLNEAQASIVLQDFELPKGWLLDPPSAWRWEQARTSVTLDFGPVRVEQIDALESQLKGKAELADLNMQLQVDRGGLAVQDLPLCFAGEMQPFSGRIDFATQTLDLNSDMPAPLLLAHMGSPSLAGERMGELAIPIHIGGRVSEPRLDLPMLAGEILSALESPITIKGLLKAAVQAAEPKPDAQPVLGAESVFPAGVPAPNRDPEVPEPPSPRRSGGGE